MPTEVVMPQMGESITEGTITKWLKKPGEPVERDEPLFEISTDKVDAEIPSPAAGTLDEIKITEGTTVGINTVVCTITEGAAAQRRTSSNGADGASASAPKAVLEPETAAMPAADSTTPAAVDAPSANMGNPSAPSAVTNSSSESDSNGAKNGMASDPGSLTEVMMPQMGESITEGTITKWLKRLGDSVQRDEPIFEISTDKVDAEIPSPVAGRLAEIKVGEGKTVTVNTVVAVIGSGAAKSASAVSGAPAGSSVLEAAPAKQQNGKPSAAAAPAAAQSASAGPQRSSPLVRKIAKENNIDLAEVPGTGASGRITKGDILERLEGGASATPAQAASVAAPVPLAPAPAPVSQATPASKPTHTQAESAPATTAPARAANLATPLPGELVPMTKMRSIIAQRMLESKRTSAHVHTVFKVDMTRIVRLREKEKTKYEQRNGVKLTYMPFITRAAVAALRKHPIVNAAVEGDAIRYNRNVNVGIAVALDWGLIVPVVRQCEEKNFLGVARSIVDLAERARSKKLAAHEVAGGTFTLTNAGIFGEQFGTPIINQPQVAILGIGGLNKEALVLTDSDGQDTVAVRSVQRFTLGFDHRIVDGADAGKFMSDFKAYLENWNEDIG